MSKNSRAVWRLQEAALQDACEEDEDLGRDMSGNYRCLEEHYDKRSLGDRVGGLVDRFRR